MMNGSKTSIQRIIRLLFALLLTAGLVNLGVAMASGGCPPGCAHCDVVAVAPVQDGHGCCDTTAGGSPAAASPAGTETAKSPADCGRGLSCLTPEEYTNSVAGVSCPEPDLTETQPVLVAFASTSSPMVSVKTRPMTPTLAKDPDLYTRNCAFLI